MGAAGLDCSKTFRQLSAQGNDLDLCERRNQSCCCCLWKLPSFPSKSGCLYPSNSGYHCLFGCHLLFGFHFLSMRPPCFLLALNSNSEADHRWLLMLILKKYCDYDADAARMLVLGLVVLRNGFVPGLIIAWPRQAQCRPGVETMACQEYRQI